MTIAEKRKRMRIMDKLLNAMASNTLRRIEKMEKAHDHGVQGQDVYSFDWILKNFINLVIDLVMSYLNIFDAFLCFGLFRILKMLRIHVNLSFFVHFVFVRNHQTVFRLWYSVWIESSAKSCF